MFAIPMDFGCHMLFLAKFECDLHGKDACVWTSRQVQVELKVRKDGKVTFNNQSFQYRYNFFERRGEVKIFH